jgi:sec-independent protein translocase protein TatA
MGFGALQPGHLILVLAIVLIIFGPGKLPQLGKSLGDGIREFRRGAEDRPADTSAASTPATPTPMAGRACRQCGAEVAAEAKFCPVCGASLASTPVA